MRRGQKDQSPRKSSTDEGKVRERERESSEDSMLLFQGWRRKLQANEYKLLLAEVSYIFTSLGHIGQRLAWVAHCREIKG